jgi:hypothetical protein
MHIKNYVPRKVKTSYNLDFRMEGVDALFKRSIIDLNELHYFTISMNCFGWVDSSHLSCTHDFYPVATHGHSPN